ncbi:ATPase with role in protein import into the ER [Tulasnella sp. 408]|nr:ATPase with role in protein import into the ER [Tulasnella sp. 408]
MFSSVFRSNWLNDCEKDVPVATVLDTNDGSKTWYVRFPKIEPTTVPVFIACGLDKQGNGKRNVLTSLGIDSLYEDMDFISITFGRFEKLCQDLSRSTHNPAEKVLAASEIDKSALNDLVLVRGQLVLPAPEEITAMLLGKMKQTAEVYLGEKATHAVVPVPAYFNDAQRTHHRPIAYGLDKNSRGADEFHIIDYNLGGGTFDASRLTIENGVFDVLANAGDTHLGGEDFVDHLASTTSPRISSASPRRTSPQMQCSPSPDNRSRVCRAYPLSDRSFSRHNCDNPFLRLRRYIERRPGRVFVSF